MFKCVQIESADNGNRIRHQIMWFHYFAEWTYDLLHYDMMYYYEALSIIIPFPACFLRVHKIIFTILYVIEWNIIQCDSKFHTVVVFNNIILSTDSFERKNKTNTAKRMNTSCKNSFFLFYECIFISTSGIFNELSVKYIYIHNFFFTSYTYIISNDSDAFVGPLSWNRAYIFHL